MKSVSGKHLCKTLERHGWILQRIRGSHHIYGKEHSKVVLTVPVHGQRDLRIGTLSAILRQAGLTEKDI